ncbi:endoribonuclease XendoU [Teladorsagia circumcincta]|uniref:Endoribonuclease XendoU n=1 Tax=Teladorsagia circumcincta TaxID=45464 RepID=A0A2G9UC47_TELCI|nr:endoribonuclease XendoU [Teladorsagia circumcincta]
MPAFSISNEELLAESRKLRQLDTNKAQRGQVRVDFQGHTKAGDVADNAADRLFTNVDDGLLTKPIYQQFLALTDNFYRETGKAEPRVSKKEEEQETTDFLTTVLQSAPMKELYQFLNSKRHPFAANPGVFGKWLHQLWFAHYSRARGVADSSGFEHVFIGEEKNKEVSGLHNWVRFYTLEKNTTENFDYKGFIVKRGYVMASVKFTWRGDLKKSGSIMIGTSPEFDMALYTLCFLSRRGNQQCEVELDGCPMGVTSYELVQNGKVYIGTIYPTAGAPSNQCGRQ